MRGTGIFASDAQIERMKQAMRMPMILVGGMAPQSAAEVCHDCALESGLPEIEGYYGCELKTKEFVTT